MNIELEKNNKITDWWADLKRVRIRKDWAWLGWGKTVWPVSGRCWTADGLDLRPEHRAMLSLDLQKCFDRVRLVNNSNRRVIFKSVGVTFKVGSQRKKRKYSSLIKDTVRIRITKPNITTNLSCRREWAPPDFVRPDCWQTGRGRARSNPRVRASLVLTGSSGWNRTIRCPSKPGWKCEYWGSDR